VKVYFTYERVVNAGCMWSGACSLTVVVPPILPVMCGHRSPRLLWELKTRYGLTKSRYGIRMTRRVPCDSVSFQ
jgi:hypothetical protein